VRPTHYVACLVACELALIYGLERLTEYLLRRGAGLTR
jgi:hypothetical protein